MKPFEVWNPFSGRWFVFHWWTDHDRGHLAFASTEDGLLDVATNVFQKEPYAECKGVLEIEVVAPSDLMSQIANKHDLEEEVMHFSYEIFGQLAYARDAGKTLPSMFVTCPKYQPEEDVTDDDWAREKHYGCQNCMNGISLVGMTKVELHARFYDDWEKTKEDRTRHRRSDSASAQTSAQHGTQGLRRRHALVRPSQLRPPCRWRRAARSRPRRERCPSPRMPDEGHPLFLPPHQGDRNRREARRCDRHHVRRLQACVGGRVRAARQSQTAGA